MYAVVMAAPIILFFGLIWAFQVPWRLALALLLLAPCGAALVLFAGGVLFTNVGLIPSSSDFISFLLFSFVAILGELIYPETTCLAILLLLIWVAAERWYPLWSSGLVPRILRAMGIGIVAALIIATADYVMFQTTIVDWGNTSGFTNRYLPPPFLFPMSILTGVFDGLILAYLSKRVSPEIGPGESASGGR